MKKRSKKKKKKLNIKGEAKLQAWHIIYISEKGKEPAWEDLYPGTCELLLVT